MKTRISPAVLIAGALAMSGVGLQAASMTLEGTVSDAKCGTKACVDKDSDYALVVGDKVYTLRTASAQEKADLATLAGQIAKVTGDVTGEKVMVKTVAMGTSPKK